ATMRRSQPAVDPSCFARRVSPVVFRPPSLVASQHRDGVLAIDRLTGTERHQRVLAHRNTLSVMQVYEIGLQRRCSRRSGDDAAVRMMEPQVAGSVTCDAEALLMHCAMMVSAQQHQIG